MAARMTDLDLLRSMGFNPKTGLPEKLGNCGTSELKQSVNRQLAVVDEQDAINRFTWTGLPDGLDARLIERILYYRGQGMLFKLNDRFMFLPYALSGTIDIYGRYESVNPLPFHGAVNDDDRKHPITGLKFIPRYEIILPEDYADADEKQIEFMINNSCVLLHDYSIAQSQTTIPRDSLNRDLLDVMADCIPFMRTALLGQTGVRGMRVGSQDEQVDVLSANESLKASALNGDQIVPIVGSVDFQDLTSKVSGSSEEFLLAMQGLDNYRLSLYGIENGGLYQKKEHMLGQEHDSNKVGSNIVLNDSLINRQEFACIVNSIYGTSIWCEINESLDEVEEEEPEDAPAMTSKTGKEEDNNAE